MFAKVTGSSPIKEICDVDSKESLSAQYIQHVTCGFNVIISAYLTQLFYLLVQDTDFFSLMPAWKGWKL